MRRDNDDIDEIVETGERLPAAMWEPDLIEADALMESPVFDGEKIVERPAED